MSRIITTEQVADYTGADIATAALIASAVNSQIEATTSRVWGEAKTVTEVHDFAAVVWLRSMDVTAVTSVKRGYQNEVRTTVETSDYTWNRNGRVTLSYSPVRQLPPVTNDSVEITYTHGVIEENVPADLVLAALNLASQAYEHHKSQGREIADTSVGSYRVSYRSGANRAMSRDWQVINSYAVQRV